MYLGGLMWAFGRRYIQRPWRLRSKTKPEDGWILTLLAIIGVTGLLTEGARIAWMGRPDFEVFGRSSGIHCRSCSPTPQPAIGTGSSGSATSRAFVAFLVMLPTTKLRHMVTSPGQHVPFARTIAQRAQ